MAVVQISKIQHRRGRKGETNIPQLASGEIGWAIDTQELYIGNGAVSEGAPYVGNTQILTEHDISSIFDRLPAYQHTGYINAVVQTFQDRLEERVSVRTFGADGIGDDTVFLQNALNDLYLTAGNLGTELYIPAGTYTISQTLQIPPNAVLRGSGKAKTIIRQTGSFPVFETVKGDDNTLSNLNQPRNISITDITFESTIPGQPIGILNSTKNSYFNNVQFKGVWVYSTSSMLANEHGLRITAASVGDLISSEENVFEKCDFVNLSYAVYSAHDIDFNTFKDCLFYQCGKGFYGTNSAGIAGQEYGPSNTKFISNKFAYIKEHGIQILKGKGNLSVGNKFVRVGNDGGSSATAAFPVIYFGDTGNSSDNDYFERSVDLSTPDSINPYISEFGGFVTGNHKFNNSVIVVSDQSNTNTLLRLGAFGNCAYRVHYSFKTTGFYRNGVLTIIVNKSDSEVRVTDEYDITGPESQSEHLSLNAVLEDTNNTVSVKYTNFSEGQPGVTGGTLTYWYEVIS